MKKRSPFLFLILFILFFCRDKSFGLEPEEVMVIANKSAVHSIELARFYMSKRKIPKQNLLKLSLTDQETCSRKEYEENAVLPAKKFLKGRDDIRAAVTLYGIPLRIASPGMTDGEYSAFSRLQDRKKSLEDLLQKKETDSGKSGSSPAEDLARIKKQISEFHKITDKTASFDSELGLVKKDSYELNMWLPNPFFIGFKKTETHALEKSDILMTSRLDGADAATVRRIINDSIQAEKQGLEGNACFDARWPNPGRKQLSGYALYDRSIHEASRIISETTGLKVTLNDRSELFQQGDCEKTALYCGWYSLANYIDAFEWARGSVGYHIASAEMTTLKNKDSRGWCKKMLDNGIAATVGPVGEPYVQAFPLPEIFFAFLADGYLSLAESYLISLPYLSWKMVLIGDPLYRMNLKGPS